MSRIDFRHLHKRYAPTLPYTIKDANLVVERGEFCVFVGPSGCGKSTLLRMVAGLEDITSGDLFFEDQRVNELPPAERGVAMVFQSYALYPHMTVAENMAFGLKVKGFAKAEIERRVHDAARILQLAPLLDRQPKALSGGQRQRVAIGRAIVTEPRVFLFDEPLSNLDAALRVQTRLEIAKLHQAVGSASMIYVTHDQVEAMTLADKIVLLQAGPDVQAHGSVAQVGAPMDLYHRPASLFVAGFIGSPKMNLLPARFVHAEGRAAVLELGGRTVVAAVDAARLAPGAAVHVGVRPEHLVVADEGEGAGLPAVLQHVERLGDVSLLYAELDGQALTVRVEGSVRPAPGTALTLRLLPHHLHVFDAEGQACPRSVELPT